jgi:cobalt-zinc-cadmium efflux system membrane fusion protein
MTPPGEAKAQAAEHSAGNGEWCKGHGLPESHCTKCHPELIDKFKAAGDWCEEHGFPESACPTCNPMDPPTAPKQAGSQAGTQAGGIAAIPGVEPGTQVIFKQDDHEKAVGIETVAAREVPVGLGTRAPARIEFDRNHFADVRAAVPGIVREVLVDLGQEVEKGTPLFVLESAHVGEVQGKIHAASEELKTARADLERQKELEEKGLTPTRNVELARQEFEAAKSRLSSLRSSLRLAGGSGTSTTGRYTLRAPIAGTIVSRPGVVGAFATEETSLASITDTKTMWAMMDVAEQESFTLEDGQPVVLAVDGAKGVEFKGKVTWISPQVDSRTRTVRVRAEIDNSDGRLRANQFARAEIGIAPDQRGVVVPKGAVQRLDQGSVVFVRMEQGTYEPRVVEPGRSDGEIVQVRGNLEAGEPVVTTGAFLLKTELSKDSIGAGCCEVPEE